MKKVRKGRGIRKEKEQWAREEMKRREKKKRGVAKGFKGVQLALMDDGFEYECECGETDKRRERGNPKGGARRKGLRDKWTGLHTLTVESGEWRVENGQGAGILFDRLFIYLLCSSLLFYFLQWPLSRLTTALTQRVSLLACLLESALDDSKISPLFYSIGQSTMDIANGNIVPV